MPRSSRTLSTRPSSCLGVRGRSRAGRDPEVAALRAAAFRRAQTEADLLEAVKQAISAGEPWKVIGEAVGTTGEAARQRVPVDAQAAKATCRRSP
jgi:hypothetical protein